MRFLSLFRRPRRVPYDTETEHVITSLYNRIRAGELRPGTPLPSLEEIRERHRPTWPTSASLAVEVLFRQGVVVFPQAGDGDDWYWVAFTPTEKSIRLQVAEPDEEPALWHLYRPARTVDGEVMPPEPNSLCGISGSVEDGSMRTLEPADTTCAACLHWYEKGAAEERAHYIGDGAK